MNTTPDTTPATAHSDTMDFAANYPRIAAAFETWGCDYAEDSEGIAVLNELFPGAMHGGYWLGMSDRYVVAYNPTICDEAEASLKDWAIARGDGEDLGDLLIELSGETPALASIGYRLKYNGLDPTSLDFIKTIHRWYCAAYIPAAVEWVKKCNEES